MPNSEIAIDNPWQATDPVRDYMPTPELFDGPHNSKITWEHLLRQTSDWEGTLWGKPEWADRPNALTRNSIRANLSAAHRRPSGNSGRISAPRPARGASTM